LSFSTPSRVKTCTSTTVPAMPEGTRSEVSFTSDAFSPKMARSSFSSGVSWVSPLGVTLPTRMSPVAHLGTDVDDARLVQLGQRRFTDVGDIAGDLLRTQLGVAGQAGQLLDMDAGEAIFLHHALGDEDRVLEVVAVPGHEGDAQVLAQRQLAHVRRRTVGSTSPRRSRCRRGLTSGRWLMQVFWLERVYLVRL
jgi:hypothetical protein